MTNYEFFYPGALSSFDAPYGSINSGRGFRSGGDFYVSAGQIGTTTGIGTANQVSEVTSRLNEGVKTVEFSMVQKDIFDQIPKQQMEEVAQLHKLTGSEATFHAPLVEASGFTERGGWSEDNRKIVEAQLLDVIKRGKQINPEGNMPITLHASAILPGATLFKDKNGKVVEDSLPVYNRVRGNIVSIPREEKHHVLEQGGVQKEWSTRDVLRELNEDWWGNQLSQIGFEKERGDRFMAGYQRVAGKPEELFSKGDAGAAEDVKMAGYMYSDVHRNLKSVFNFAMNSADEKTKNQLRNVAQAYTNDLKKVEEAPGIQKYSFQSQALHNLLTNMRQVLSEGKSVDGKSDLKVPQIYTPAEDFAVEHSSKTFGNVAFDSYKEFRGKAPVISIENPPYGGAIATGEDLKNLIEASRKQFVARAKEEGMSESQAKKLAEKHIGATWDTVHIAQMKERGFTNEDMIKEARKIAPYVKHVHMNDSLSGGRNDLPPGMGDLPIKVIIQEFEDRGFKGKKIFEGGAFFGQFKTPAHGYVLEAMGSPIYPMKADSYWKNSTFGSYDSGFGPTLPEQHFSMYGAGFTNLPMALGGQIPGRDSRGTPMA